MTKTAGDRQRPFEGFVGIFWAVRAGSDVIILEHRCPLNHAERYGDMLTCPHGHFEIWEEWRVDAAPPGEDVRPAVTDSEYEDWPRGRVVCHRDLRQVVLYADTQILERRNLVATLYQIFGLPPGTQEKRDEHYRSTRKL